MAQTDALLLGAPALRVAECASEDKHFAALAHLKVFGRQLQHIRDIRLPRKALRDSVCVTAVTEILGQEGISLRTKNENPKIESAYRKPKTEILIHAG